VFDKFVESRVSAVMVVGDAVFFSQRKFIVERAAASVAFFFQIAVTLIGTAATTASPASAQSAAPTLASGRATGICSLSDVHRFLQDDGCR
jgi:hypothetical protein